MPVIVTQLEHGVTRVILSDRIDAAGAVDISMDLYYVGESSDSVIIDLARVSFIASLGLRNIVSMAKAVFKRGGKVVLLSPQTAVEEVLTNSGIIDLIPVYRKQTLAEAAVALPPS
jgi:anti-anti-sigma factor